jgi:hypothetical protein
MRKVLENTSYTVRIKYRLGRLPITYPLKATALLPCFYNTNLSIGKLNSTKNPIIPSNRKIPEAAPTYKRKQRATKPVIPVKKIFNIVSFFSPNFLTPPRGAFENKYSLKDISNNPQKISNQIFSAFDRRKIWSYINHTPRICGFFKTLKRILLCPPYPIYIEVYLSGFIYFKIKVFSIIWHLKRAYKYIVGVIKTIGGCLLKIKVFSEQLFWDIPRYLPKTKVVVSK